jgi:hypothetical protein
MCAASGQQHRSAVLYNSQLLTFLNAANHLSVDVHTAQHFLRIRYHIVEQRQSIVMDVNKTLPLSLRGKCALIRRLPGKAVPGGVKVSGEEQWIYVQ